MTTQDDPFARGLDMVDTVFGPGVRDMLTAAAVRPTVDHTVRTLFGEIWSRPHLQVRDRRLLVLGIVSMLGRPELIEVQVLGALRNGELDEAALNEMCLMVSYYAGWPNGTAMEAGVQAALARFRAEGTKD